MPSASQPKISPDGKSIAYVTTIMGGRKSVVAHSMTEMKKDRTMVLPPIDEADISDFTWANDDTLLVTYSFYGGNFLYKGNKIEQTRLVAASFGQQAFNLVKASRDQKRSYGGKTSIAATQSNIIDMLPSDPDHILLALDDDLDGDPDVRKINVYTGKYTIVQRGRSKVVEWLTDNQGVPVLGFDTYAKNTTVYIHKSKRDTWSEAAIIELLDSGYNPVDIYEDGNSALFYTVNRYGREALGRFSLETGKLLEWVYSNKKYDVQGLYYSDMTGEVSGTAYMDTTYRQVFLGGKEKKVLAALNKAMPNSQNILLSSDKTGTLWMAAVESPTLTPMIVSLNVTTGVMGTFVDQYEEIDDAHIAPTKKYDVRMRDDLEIEAYVTTPLGREAQNLPTIIMPHGGPSARDDDSFDPEAQMLANRGYIVIKPNFRGSDGYGVPFEMMGNQQWGGTMQDDVTDTARWAIETGLADPKRMCIVGGSYGGYAAMMAAVNTPDLFACAVSLNGVVDLPLLWTDDAKFIWYQEMRDSIGERRSDLKEISPYHRADEIKIPVLLVAAKDDARVNYKHSQRMFKRMKKKKQDVTYLQLKSGGHSVDVNEERARYFSTLETFLAKHIGGARFKQASR